MHILTKNRRICKDPSEDVISRVNGLVDGSSTKFAGLE